jgi:hypothetical protein
MPHHTMLRAGPHTPHRSAYPETPYHALMDSTHTTSPNTGHHPTRATNSIGLGTDKNNASKTQPGAARRVRPMHAASRTKEEAHRHTAGPAAGAHTSRSHNHWALSHVTSIGSAIVGGGRRPSAVQRNSPSGQQLARPDPPNGDSPHRHSCYWLHRCNCHHPHSPRPALADRSMRGQQRLPWQPSKQQRTFAPQSSCRHGKCASRSIRLHSACPRPTGCTQLSCMTAWLPGWHAAAPHRSLAACSNPASPPAAGLPHIPPRASRQGRPRAVRAVLYTATAAAVTSDPPAFIMLLVALTLAK